MAGNTPTDVGQIASEIGSLLKVKYGPAVVDQMNNTPMLWRMFDESPITSGGDHYEFPACMQMPWSVGPRPYRTGLPVVVKSVEATCKVFDKYHYATFDITGPDLRRAQGNEQSFVEGLSYQMDRLTTSFAKDMNFQSYLAGNGLYARILTLPGTATTVTVDTVKYLREGRRIDIWDENAAPPSIGFGSANSTATYLQITAIDPVTNTVTFQANRWAGVQVNDVIMPETGLVGATTSTAVGIFLNGLGAIVDDGTNLTTFQNISRTTYPRWKASVFSAGGVARDLNLGLMQYLVAIPKAKGGEEIDFIVCAPNGEKQYLDLLVSQKRFMTEKLDGGYRTLEYNGKTILVDQDCQDDVIYGLKRSSIKRFGTFNAEFDDTDGKVLKWSPTQGDTFVGFLKMYGNLGTDRCNVNAKITDLTKDSNFAILN